MRIISTRHIEGPNIYLYKPIMVARIHLEEFTERESFHYPGLVDGLLERLPGLREHHCAKGEPGGFVERLHGGTYFGHIVEHVAIELASCLGLDVHYGKTLYADGPGIYDIVMECKSYECQKRLLYGAVEVVKCLARGVRPSLEPLYEEARAILAKTQLGPSTAAIVAACQRRNIPVRRIGTGDLLELGYGIYRQRVAATITDQTSCVAVDIASDKEETKVVLREGGIPVPVGELARSAAEAIEIWQSLGGPVVLKPLNGRQGQGVSLNINQVAQVHQAFDIACQYGPVVIVESYLVGQNVRLLVVDGRCVAVSRREPASVVGDGKKTIGQLIEALNADPRRGVGHEKPLTQIHVDVVVEATLANAGKTLASIPAPGERVLLRDSANLSTGGEAHDITRQIDVSYKRLAERSARLIGLDVCGIDMVVQNIREPASADNCAVIEVNAAPGIRMHQHPSHGMARDVADDIVASLFPNRQNGRIPIIAVTGTNGKTTTTRLIAHGLRREGKTVGMTTTGGVYINDELIQPGDTTGPRSARLVLSDPQVEVAVLETARGGIVRGGLAYDKADVAVMTNITLDHVGQDMIDNIDDLVHVKSLVAECVHEEGTVVLNADDPQLIKLAGRLEANVVLTSSRADNRDVQRHVAMGGTAFYVENGQVMEANGSLKRSVVAISDIPLTMRGTIGFHIENAVLATAALRVSGVSRRVVSLALQQFQPEANRGRCMIYRMPNQSYVVLDYAHNPAGFKRIGEWLKQLPHQHLFGVVGVPGDRANHVVELAAETLGPIFDAFIVKEDEHKRGRREGEIAQILAQTLDKVAPGKPVRVVLPEVAALETAVQMLKSADIAVVFYESAEPLERLLLAKGGERVNDILAADVNRTYAML